MPNYTLSDDDIKRIAVEEGVDPAHLLAISKKENSGDNAVSNKGAVGRFQLLPATFNSVLPDGDISNPVDNARASARYIKQGLDKNGGDFNKAAMYYYAGPNFQDKITKAPNQKYGGLSIEDYGRQAVANLPVPSAGDVNVAEADADANMVAPNTPTPQPIQSKTAFGIDLDGINAEIAKLAQQGQQALEKAGVASETLSTQLKNNVKEQMSLMDSMGQNAAVAKLDEYQQQKTRAAEVSADLSRRGINLSDIDSVVAQAAVDNREDYNTAMALREQIDAKRSIGLTDDLFGWIGARLTLPTEIRQHNAVIQRMDARKAYVDQTAATASTVQAANAGKFVPMSLEGAQAAAQVIRDKAHLDSLSIQDKLLHQDYDTQVRALSLISSQIQLKTMLETRAESLQQKRTADDIRAGEQERKKLDDMQVNVAAKVLGMEVMDRKALDKLPKDAKAAIEYIMSNDGGIGKEPMEALGVLRRGNPGAMPPLVKLQMDTLADAYNQASNTMNKDKVFASSAPTSEKQAQYLNREMSKILDRAHADPNYGGIKNNPYHVPSLETMRDLPATAKNPLVQSLEAFKKLNPNTQLTDTMIYNIALADIGPGKMFKDHTDAAKAVADYYKNGILYNNQKLRFEGFGMQKQEDYKVDGIDLSSYSQVMQKFLRMTTPNKQLLMDPTIFGAGA